MEAGEKFREATKKYGVSSTAAQMIQKRTNEEDTGNQNIKKKKVNGCQVAQKVKLCQGARKLDKNLKKYNKK